MLLVFKWLPTFIITNYIYFPFILPSSILKLKYTKINYNVAEYLIKNTQILMYS